MCWMAAIPYVVSAVAGGMQAYGQYKQGVAQQKYYNYVADAAEAEGELAYKRGEKQSDLIQDSASFQGKRQKIEAAQIASSQRAALAANGIDLSSVTASDLATETMSKSRLDELAIRYNADINTWNTMEDAKYKRWSGQFQAAGNRFAGKSAKRAGQMQAMTTLLGTAASMAMGGLLANSGSTQGVTGWLSGYKNAPKGSFNTGSMSLLPR